MTDAEMIQGGKDSDQLSRLQEIMHRLRSPGGCPWDAEQTHQSIIPNLVEEVYEVIDALDQKDDKHLQEELGDLLLQVFFHAEIADGDGRFELNDVARGICDKLIRRHPHVFGTESAVSADEVLTKWDAIKKGERSEEDKGYLYGVGRGLPALIRAAKLQKKAADVGFDWPVETGVLSKIREELCELQSAIDSQNIEAVEEEMGDLLFSVVNLARFRKIDPEILMERANRKFERRFGEMERLLAKQEKSLGDASFNDFEEKWVQVKEMEL